ncbi:MAG: sigma-70 family RNA polymerase sigma factor [Candidatus Delongbacteria bacterium]|nr:sigma-70 family RNA polymerase sigma factor [Candidatus Delongbacteria bacterium]
MNDRNDETRLVERILNEDARAFALLVNDYRRLVLHIVGNRVHHSEELEDLCQEIFLKVYTHLKGFRHQSRLSTWIGRIAYYHTLNFCRQQSKEKRTQVLEDETEADPDLGSLLIPSRPAPDQEAELQETRQILQRAIDKLPEKYRLIIKLFHWDNLSYQEIGHILDLPEGTIKSHLFRSRNLLKDLLVKEYKTEELWSL